MNKQFSYTSNPASKSKSEFNKLIKDAFRKEHGRMKGLRIEWNWFKRDVEYPTGLRGTTGSITVYADGFRTHSYILTAAYYPNGEFHWRIQ